ncbi:MAG: cytochrome d ubiquinol oxidase subunit II, partial [Gemmatimonadaceae bacterium]|nr:cytochrome d ubiquinol oxidase subunit II [Gemmatimonadaceae bacterium]
MTNTIFTLPHLAAGTMVIALNLYVLFGGADFGGGIWDLLASGPRQRQQRVLIARAIGPIWEANHVWLILGVVLLFTCFPGAYAAISTVLHIPLTLMLVGVVLRGSAFTFRTYDARTDVVQRRWGAIFAIASAVTPVLLGICVGAVADGGVARDATLDLARTDFVTRFIAPWNTPFAWSVGVLTLALFAHLAAVYLCVEAGHEALREDFRRRALVSAVVVAVSAFVAFALAWAEAPLVGRGLTTGSVAVFVHVATACAAIATLWALMRRRYQLARVSVALQASFIVWG